jgi:hypothetical protein
MTVDAAALPGESRPVLLHGAHNHWQFSRICQALSQDYALACETPGDISRDRDLDNELCVIRGSRSSFASRTTVRWRLVPIFAIVAK